jgi:hypothetical protein
MRAAHAQRSRGRRRCRLELRTIFPKAGLTAFDFRWCRHQSTDTSEVGYPKSAFLVPFPFALRSCPRILPDVPYDRRLFPED